MDAASLVEDPDDTGSLAIADVANNRLALTIAGLVSQKYEDFLDMVDSRPHTVGKIYYGEMHPQPIATRIKSLRLV